MPPACLATSAVCKQAEWISGDVLLRIALMFTVCAQERPSIVTCNFALLLCASAGLCFTCVLKTSRSKRISMLSKFMAGCRGNCRLAHEGAYAVWPSALLQFNNAPGRGKRPGIRVPLVPAECPLPPKPQPHHSWTDCRANTTRAQHTLVEQHD